MALGLCVSLHADPLEPQVKISAMDEGIFHLSIGGAETHSTFLADDNAANRSVGQPVSNGDWSGVQTSDGELLLIEVR